MNSLDEEREQLARVARQIARICIDHGMHFVGALGRVLPDGETLAIVSTQVTESAFVASMLAQSIGPMMEDSLQQAEQAARQPIVDLGPLN